jgi:hypothetical protein
VQTVKALNLVEAPANPTLKNILQILASIFNTKAAIICIDAGDTTLSFDARGTVDAGLFGLYGFSAWTMSGQKPRVLAVCDTLEDAR